VIQVLFDHTRCVFSLLLLSVSTSATATTLQVPGQYATVSDAVDAAADGDVIAIAAGDFSGEWISKMDSRSLTFIGAGPGLTFFPELWFTGLIGPAGSLTIEAVTLPCADLALVVGSDSLATLTNVEATGCTLSDPLIMVTGDVLIEASRFADMTTEGGGVLYLRNGNHTLDAVTFENVTSTVPAICDPASEICDSTGAAGVFYMSVLSVTNSTFDGCMADAGSCIFYFGGVFLAFDSGRATITDTTFSNNTAFVDGAAIKAVDFESFVVEDSTFVDNVAVAGSVVILDDNPLDAFTGDNDAYMRLTRVRAEGNQVAGDGAVFAFRGVENNAIDGETVEVESSWFCGNSNLGGPSDVLFENIDDLTILGTAMALGAGTASTEIRSSSAFLANVTFAGHAGSAILASTVGFAPDVALSSTLFADLGGFAVESGFPISASGTHLGLHDTVGWSDAIIDAALNPNAVELDPVFQSYASGMSTCADISLWLDAGSPMRDAGDPALDTDGIGGSDTDPDGTAIDIGAFGGRLANLADVDVDGVYEDLDCDDDDAATYPGATEVPYDGVDQDCDGADLEDVDGDGEAADLVGGPDCDDGDPDIHTGAVEIWYDGIDQDCAGDDDYDQDGDGEQSDQHGGLDCDDVDAAINTMAAEVWYDDVDQDCDGGDDFDQDGDGFPSDAYGGIDCDDLNAEVGPGLTEIWYDGIDQDCDGNDADQDGDGFDLEDDCDDLDSKVNPDALDTAEDGTDQNCDGVDGPGDDGGGNGSQTADGDSGGCNCSASGGNSPVSWLVVFIGAASLMRRTTRQSKLGRPNS
jgi:predicted outer membrane repeat protein